VKNLAANFDRLPAEGLFLARWLKAPHRIGALTPASRHLARAMADQIGPAEAMVIELGGGTGSVTRALLDSGLDPKHLVVIEHDRAFHALLARRFPLVNVIRGDAADLRALLSPYGIERCSAVVSSLPLLSLPKPQRLKIVAEAFALLGERGRFIQYTYGAFSPLRRRETGLKGEVAERVWRNFPPAAVWRYRRREAAEAA
jgi:phosphatidylethanolamine/phosphatidyl-N-methylethanolamine N-methyltransferase